MKQTTIRQLKKGDFFCLHEYDDTMKEVNSSVVWVRGDYEKSLKRFSCCKFDDMNNERFFKGDKVVYSEIYF